MWYNVFVINAALGLILLTYKGKVLLMLHETLPTIKDLDIWRFIGKAEEKDKSFEKTLSSEVERETGIQLNTVEFLSSAQYSDQKKYFYHAALTDDDVNNMKRGERQLLQFFSLQEVEKLPLTISTRQLLSKHKDLIEKAPQN